MIYRRQIIMPYSVNIYRAVCQLHVNKPGRKKINSQIWDSTGLEDRDKTRLKPLMFFFGLWVNSHVLWGSKWATAGSLWLLGCLFPSSVGFRSGQWEVRSANGMAVLPVESLCCSPKFSDAESSVQLVRLASVCASFGGLNSLVREAVTRQSLFTPLLITVTPRIQICKTH